MVSVRTRGSTKIQLEQTEPANSAKHTIPYSHRMLGARTSVGLFCKLLADEIWLTRAALMSRVKTHDSRDNTPSLQPMPMPDDNNFTNEAPMPWPESAELVIVFAVAERALAVAQRAAKVTPQR